MRITAPGPRSTRRMRPRINRRVGHRFWWPACSSVIFACFTLSAQTLPIEPARDAGASVTGAFEGWFKNADGTFSLLLGYYNRNRKQEVDVPIGPNNRIEALGSGAPAGPDRGQPTHFLPGRGWG